MSVNFFLIACSMQEPTLNETWKPDTDTYTKSFLMETSRYKKL
jgi:hypothetical protein